MAVKYSEVEVLGGGIKSDRPSKGSFALNLLRRYGAWEVRQGFGQLAQFDTRITHNIDGASTVWGYEKHLGSYIMQTDFGHEQILSVFKARVYSSEVKNERAQIANVYVVSIYDTTTRERWEEPLYRHTSEAGLVKEDNDQRRGHYETNRDKDYQSWVVATSEENFQFAEVGDTVYFGSPATQLYAYTPCTFRGSRRRSVAGAHPHAWCPPYSESSMIWRVRPSPGADPEAYVYRTSSGIPSPQALIAWGGRLVIAGNKREVFFSQRYAPTAYIDFDYIVVPTEQSITAMAPMGQSIYVFTETETFFYQPASTTGDEVASQGMEPVLVSDNIGCVSQSCVTKTDNAVMWLSSTGVHVSGNPMQIETISDPIAPLFTDFITDPMTTFFTTVTAETGSINTRLPQRNSVIKPNLDGASMTYSEKLAALFVTLPDERVSLCYTEGQWSVWTYESNTADYTGLPDVGAQRNIERPWLLCRDQSFYLMGSLQTQPFVDEARFAGPFDVNDDSTSRSAYLLEYGRGGAIDRSVDDEDERGLAGKYKHYPVGGVTPSGFTPTLVLGEWVPVEQQYKFQGTSTAAPTGESAPGAPNKTFLVPVYLVPGPLWTGAAAANSIARIRIRFFFDSTKWRPIFDNGTSTNINLVFPPERTSTASGWTTRACEDTTGVPDRAGAEVHLDWQGASVAPAHTFAPYMNLVPNKLNLLCYIPMQTTADANVSSMAVSEPFVTPPGYINTWCFVTDGAAFDHAAEEVLVWCQWRLFDTNKEDNVAQPVDWAYMSEDVGLPEDARVKGRGVVARLLSHDVGTDVTGSWSQSIFNTMMASDMKMWTPQVIDYVGSPTAFKGPVSIKSNLYSRAYDHGTVRDRVQKSDKSLVRPNYGQGITYGNEATETFEANTYLIGDEQVDEIVTSESMKGNSVAMMLFGFMRNPAERLKLESVKLLFRVIGAGRRRRGR